MTKLNQWFSLICETFEKMLLEMLIILTPICIIEQIVIAVINALN